MCVPVQLLLLVVSWLVGSETEWAIRVSDKVNKSVNDKIVIVPVQRRLVCGC